MDDNWDLHAVVRACYNTTITNTKNTCNIAFGANLDSPSNDNNNHQLNSFFVNPFENLHEFYNPLISPQNIPISSSLASLSASNQQSQVFQQQQQLKNPHSLISTKTITKETTKSASSRLPRSKRRKNLVKRVCHVAADALSSDTWGWRKYGQKPIKGSPYPRGYYRCSSSNGCLARKQVERNKSDPSMFVVTYTAEHDHPAPTHRNSLAGSTRLKPQTTTTTCTNSQPSCSIDQANSLDDDNEPVLSSMAVIDDDFFEGLEEFDCSTGCVDFLSK